jgi:hypothetical protein
MRRYKIFDFLSTNPVYRRARDEKAAGVSSLGNPNKEGRSED